jgi:hypothetical protein
MTSLLQEHLHAYSHGKIIPARRKRGRNRYVAKMQLRANKVNDERTIVSSNSALQSHGDMTSAISDFARVTKALKVNVLRCAELA